MKAGFWCTLCLGCTAMLGVTPTAIQHGRGALRVQQSKLSLYAFLERKSLSGFLRAAF